MTRFQSIRVSRRGEGDKRCYFVFGQDFDIESVIALTPQPPVPAGEGKPIIGPSPGGTGGWGVTAKCHGRYSLDTHGVSDAV